MRECSEAEYVACWNTHGSDMKSFGAVHEGDNIITLWGIEQYAECKFQRKDGVKHYWIKE